MTKRREQELERQEHQGTVRSALSAWQDQLTGADSKPSERHAHAVDPEQTLYYATTKGLRSIPYIVLSNTSIDEASALYLSYLLANHHLPDKLLSRVPPAKAGSHAQQLASYDVETQCRGVIYLPNSKLSNSASKVMDLAEDARCNLLNPTSATNGSLDQDHHREGTQSKGTMPGRRRRSSHMTEEKTRESIVADLDHARSRLQGNVIETLGHASNDLWRVALKMLPISRIMQPQVVKEASSPMPPSTACMRPMSRTRR